MELKDFIRKSLLEISAALREANEGHKKSIGSDNNTFFLAPGSEKQAGKGIHFDLAVTTRSEKGTAGKAGVNISVVELKTGGESKKASERISRLSFTVDVGHWVG